MCKDEVKSQGKICDTRKGGNIQSMGTIYTHTHKYCMLDQGVQLKQLEELIKFIVWLDRSDNDRGLGHPKLNDYTQQHKPISSVSIRI